MIEKTHPGQRAQTLALLNLVAQREHCTWHELFRATCPNADVCHSDDTRRFNDRLQYLCNSGQLQSIGIGRGRQFWLGPRHSGPQTQACAPGAASAEVRVQPSAELNSPSAAHSVLSTGPVVPARTHDVMHGPVYQPSPNSAMRPGALDYQRHASFGVRC